MKFPGNIVVRPGSAVRLADLDPHDTLHFTDKEATKAGTIEKAEQINRLQDALYAEGKRSLLVILQGIDTSGKDGTIRDVFNATGPLGVHFLAHGAAADGNAAEQPIWLTIGDDNPNQPVPPAL